MADETVSTVAEGATTPAPADPVETTAPTEAPDVFASRDPWADLGKDEQPEEAKADEPKAEPDKADDKTDDTPLEDKVLEEAFSDKPVADETADIDKQDPEEMANAQRNATAKSYLARAERVYSPAKDFKYGKIEAPEFAAKLSEFIGDEKAREYAQSEAHKLVDTNPDAAFKRAYAVTMLKADPNWDIETATFPTLAEVIANGGKSADAVTSKPVEMPDLAPLTTELEKTVDWDWRDESLDDNFADERELALAKFARAAEVKAQTDATENAELKTKVGDLEGRLQGVEKGKASEVQTAVHSKLNEVTTSYRKGVEDKILPYIAKNTGLEVSKEDTPEIAAFKESRMTLYTGTEYERANGLDSAFEAFAYNESSVKKELETVVTRLVDVQLKETQAILSGDKAAADKYHREAEDEKTPLIQLLAQANNEFKAKRITPDLELIGKLSTHLAAPIKEASERQEIVTGAGDGAAQTRKPAYRTADDVWGGMVEEAQKDDALRANA